MPHPLSSPVRNIALRHLPFREAPVLRDAAGELDRLHEIEAAWDWCEANERWPYMVEMDGLDDWMWTVNDDGDYFRTPLEAVQSAKKSLAPRP